ncbi:MAG: D-alanine--D-alanine ligase A, partial [Anaerolineae bacterium]|nr:D-alanine--D-alanine ligase A [Anaerolineae bacterium]
MSAKLRVAVLFGGRSGEHAVSLMSAAFILRVLDPAKYDVVPVGISRQGDWWMGDDALELMQSGETKGLTAVTMLPDPGRPGLASPDGST